MSMRVIMWVTLIFLIKIASLAENAAVMDHYIGLNYAAGWQGGIGSLTWQREHPKNNSFPQSCGTCARLHYKSRD
jgi:hypothetical protein